MASDLGKIRAGSPRVYRDRVFGTRGEIVRVSEEQSVDGLARYVVHPDDVTEMGAAVLEEWLRIVYPDHSPDHSPTVVEVMLRLLAGDPG